MVCWRRIKDNTSAVVPSGTANLGILCPGIHTVSTREIGEGESKRIIWMLVAWAVEERVRCFSSITKGRK